MNAIFARKMYEQTKTRSVSNESQNILAIKICLEQLISSMRDLSCCETIEAKEENVQVALSRIYILQKCLDFENGGELAANLFRVYENARRVIIGFSFAKNDQIDLENSIMHISMILEGWSTVFD